MDARAVKDALYARHHASGEQMPGAWTVLEEFRGIDLLAFSAWWSAGSCARVGYEVKVSRSDMRSELLNPIKRSRNVEWCNEFYFAVPAGMMTDEELSWKEPTWTPEDWTRKRCQGVGGRQCRPYRSGGKRHYVVVPVPAVSSYRDDLETSIVCPTCAGKGSVSRSRVEEESPTLWVPADVGLVVVDGRGTRVVRRSPRRQEVPVLGPHELGQLVRWVSMRPDPRHYVRHARVGLRDSS